MVTGTSRPQGRGRQGHGTPPTLRRRPRRHGPRHGGHVRTARTGGHDPRLVPRRRPDDGIAPYLNPEEHAEAYARSDAYLFASEEEYALCRGDGYTPDDGTRRAGSHRRRKRSRVTPVRTGLLGVSAAVAIGTVAVATGAGARPGQLQARRRQRRRRGAGRELADELPGRAGRHLRQRRRPRDGRSTSRDADRSASPSPSPSTVLGRRRPRRRRRSRRPTPSKKPEATPSTAGTAPEAGKRRRTAPRGRFRGGRRRGRGAQARQRGAGEGRAAARSPPTARWPTWPQTFSEDMADARLLRPHRPDGATPVGPGREGRDHQPRRREHRPGPGRRRPR